MNVGYMVQVAQVTDLADVSAEIAYVRESGGFWVHKSVPYRDAIWYEGEGNWVPLEQLIQTKVHVLYTRWCNYVDLDFWPTGWGSYERIQEWGPRTPADNTNITVVPGELIFRRQDFDVTFGEPDGLSLPITTTEYIPRTFCNGPAAKIICADGSVHWVKEVYPYYEGDGPEPFYAPAPGPTTRLELYAELTSEPVSVIAERWYCVSNEVLADNDYRTPKCPKYYYIGERLGNFRKRLHTFRDTSVNKRRMTAGDLGYDGDVWYQYIPKQRTRDTTFDLAQLASLYVADNRSNLLAPATHEKHFLLRTDHRKQQGSMLIEKLSGLAVTSDLGTFEYRPGELTYVRKPEVNDG